jgi:hypothetical protein
MTVKNIEFPKLRIDRRHDNHMAWLAMCPKANKSMEILGVTSCWDWEESPSSKILARVLSVVHIIACLGSFCTQKSKNQPF